MAGNIRAFLTETIGAFALVFFAAGAVCLDAVSGGKVGAVGAAAAYGLALAVMGWSYGPAAGGWYNPAITAALLLHRRLSALNAVFFFIAQLLGAALAGILLKAVLHNRPELMTAAPFLGACDLGLLGFKAGTLVEAVATFFLASATYGAAVDPKASPQSAPLAVGAAAMLGSLVAGPLTGGAMNPARAFGPAVTTGHWAHWYVYWVGPVAGAFAASAFFEYLILEKKR